MAQPVPVVLVTGASRGIGRGIACRLANLGFSVAVNYASHEASAEETVTLCKKSRVSVQQRFVALQADVGLAGDRDRLVRDTLREYGRIDALVNNAGIGPSVRVDPTETTEESFSEVLRVNLHGPFFLTQQVVNYWLKEKPAPASEHGFTIIFVSSISATVASLNRSEYCISKAGVAMASQIWALRLAEEGIQVFDLRPGIVATDMTAGVKEKYDKMFADGVVPQKRWGQPEDVGLAVGAILTGAFRYSTGEVIHIDGGFHIQKM